jgi:hypothetical protein
MDGKPKPNPKVNFNTQIKYGLLYNTILVKAKVQGGIRAPQGSVAPFVNGMVGLFRGYALDENGEVEFEWHSANYVTQRVGKNTIKLVYEPIYDWHDKHLADEFYGSSISEEQVYYSVPLIYPIVVLAIISLITGLRARKLKRRVDRPYDDE